MPTIYDFANQSENNYLVMEMLGLSLQDLFRICKRKFSLKTTLMLAEQMITRIEFLHRKTFVHRDIKPDNFCIGRGAKKNAAYLIDYGMAKRYLVKDSHIEYKDNKALTGSKRYCSINAHLGIEQSRRDDLESLGYVLVYLLKGSLPWQQTTAMK